MKNIITHSFSGQHSQDTQDARVVFQNYGIIKNTVKLHETCHVLYFHVWSKTRQKKTFCDNRQRQTGNEFISSNWSSSRAVSELSELLTGSANSDDICEIASVI